jgi:hypothetical protein
VLSAQTTTQNRVAHNEKCSIELFEYPGVGHYALSFQPNHWLLFKKIVHKWSLSIQEISWLMKIKIYLCWTISSATTGLHYGSDLTVYRPYFECACHDIQIIITTFWIRLLVLLLRMSSIRFSILFLLILDISTFTNTFPKNHLHLGWASCRMG